MANITRYDSPFEDLFNDLTRGFLVRPLTIAGQTFGGRDALGMKLDVSDDDNAYVVDAEIPGVRKEDIQVEIHGEQVSIRAEAKQQREEKKEGRVVYSERSHGTLARSFSLPGEVDAQGAKAEYRDGVLHLVLPKSAGSQAKRLSIQ